jgi:hypothetical protein
MQRGAKPARARVSRKPRKNKGPRSRQLEKRLAEARDQQTATNEILKVISGSPSDAPPVFEAIVASAARLCEATFSAVARFDGGLLHLVAMSNMSPEETEAYRTIFPRPPGGRPLPEGAKVAFRLNQP